MKNIAGTPVVGEAAERFGKTAKQWETKNCRGRWDLCSCPTRWSIDHQSQSPVNRETGYKQCTRWDLCSCRADEESSEKQWNTKTLNNWDIYFLRGQRRLVVQVVQLGGQQGGEFVETLKQLRRKLGQRRDNPNLSLLAPFLTSIPGCALYLNMEQNIEMPKHDRRDMIIQKKCCVEPIQCIFSPKYFVWT